MTRREEKKLFGELLRASAVGLNLVLSTFVGLAIGYGLDKLLKTSPLFTIIFLLLGIIAGFMELFRVAKKQDNGTNKKNT